MGQAKKRKSQIDALKRDMGAAWERWNVGPNDQRHLVRGVDPQHNGPEPTIALASALRKLLEQAKIDGSVDEPVAFVAAMVNATTRGLSDLPIACGKGCSHCCHLWVSVSALEALALAKIARKRGDDIIARIRAADDFTHRYSHGDRHAHPHPCPFLENNVCSIYEDRPASCRQAASEDAEICERSFFRTNEEVPTPLPYLVSRTLYGIAMVCALKEAGLDHKTYELNNAVVRALALENAEARWLAGEDIFNGVPVEPVDWFSKPEVCQIYALAFGHSVGDELKKSF